MHTLLQHDKNNIVRRSFIDLTPYIIRRSTSNAVEI